MDYFNSRNYVITTADGIVRGAKWCYVKKMMDRFMIPAERTDLYNPNNVAVEETDGIELDPELFEVE
jgi:hypothetical protein